MEYNLEGKTFGFRYQETRRHHERFCAMSDEEFLRNLPSAAHLACFISWIKELPHDLCLGDLGIVHQLIHLMDSPDPCIELQAIRERFENYLKLA